MNATRMKRWLPLVAWLLVLACGSTTIANPVIPGDSLGQPQQPAPATATQPGVELADSTMVEGHRVWYPANWFLFTEVDMTAFSPVPIDLNEEAVSSPLFAVFHTLSYGTDGVPQASPLELASQAASEFLASAVDDPTPVTVAGYTWYRFGFENLMGFQGSSRGWLAVYADLSGVRLVLAVAPSGEWEQYEDIFELMFQSME